MGRPLFTFIRRRVTENVIELRETFISLDPEQRDFFVCIASVVILSS